jgi:hypothetical protein
MYTPLEIATHGAMMTGMGIDGWDYEVVIAGIDAISGSMVCRDSENLLKWIII